MKKPVCETVSEAIWFETRRNIALLAEEARLTVDSLELPPRKHKSHCLPSHLMAECGAAGFVLAQAYMNQCE